MRSNEIPVCGLKAIKALFAQHPQSIQRLFFDAPMSRRIGVMTRTLAAERKVYRLVEPAELEKISGTLHHGGIVAIINAPALKAPRPQDVAAWARERELILILDRIGNPHNLGAIIRTAAWFGVRRIIIPADPMAAVPGEAAWRVAEGGMEFVEFFRVPNLPVFCREIRNHYDVIGTSLKGKNLGGNTQRTKPVALVLGNEEHGLADDVGAVCTQLVKIPGANTVESLNVSVAAAILMWELQGQKPLPAAR